MFVCEHNIQKFSAPILIQEPVKPVDSCSQERRGLLSAVVDAFDRLTTSSKVMGTWFGPGPKNYLNLIVQRGRIEGFLVLDYMSRAAEAMGALAGWVQAGKLKNKVDVLHGLENRRRRCGGWEQRDLAETSKVSLPSIKRLETTPGPLAAQPRTIEAIRSALEAAGVEFTNGEQPGVRLRKG